MSAKPYDENSYSKKYSDSKRRISLYDYKSSELFVIKQLIETYYTVYKSSWVPNSNPSQFEDLAD
jgi:hypothetical protein